MNNCDFCNKIYSSKEEYDEFCGHNWWNEIDAIIMDKNNQPGLYVPCDDSYYSRIVMDINFCPKCGRKINPEYKNDRVMV